MPKIVAGVPGRVVAAPATPIEVKLTLGKEKVNAAEDQFDGTPKNLLRDLVRFSAAPVKKGIKVCGLLSALAEKDIKRFTNFVDEFKADHLQKIQFLKMPSEKWILKNLSEVILTGLNEAGLLQVAYSGELEIMRKEVEDLRVIQDAMDEVGQLLQQCSSFEKWKTELSKYCSLLHSKDSDLKECYELWFTIKKAAKDALFTKIGQTEDKSALFKKLCVFDARNYYSTTEQRELIKNLVFLPSGCKHEYAKEFARKDIVKELSDSALQSLERLGVVEKKDLSSMHEDDYLSFLERQGKYYRFSEKALRELGDASLLEATLS